MTNIEFTRNLIEKSFKVKKTEVIDQYQVSFEVEKNDIHQILTVLKSSGWIQLSYLSAIDWIAENEFELVYIVMNWERAVHVQIRTRINRTNPEMNSIMPIYEGCKYYEREAHEFFGIKFPGNPDYHKQLILEQWDDIPPLRKDFDPRAYSDAHFAKREYTKDFTNLNNQPSKQEKRTERKSFISRLKGGKK
ncbi:NADH-quinone oxidoreductase subunit C [Candidatus Izimaplasma bacterium HR1]|jgi:NADH-quinone oxidoreductase subunit C|uniref:NADH-quinone oxidoreductase subunit C n=1 Tax=Candidatus Izimoplasma sp. HR1 TaxID=1541959 RepID=UPI0004F5893D|nr:NADH-quinone oxidoreductase subunit C [Candidatus Izimaplasma bacterium HR1]